MDNSPLGQLPPELRNRVFQDVMASREIDVYVCRKGTAFATDPPHRTNPEPDDTHVVSFTSDLASYSLNMQSWSPGLLRTCKEINNEICGYPTPVQGTIAQMTFHLYLFPVNVCWRERLSADYHDDWRRSMFTWYRRLIIGALPRPNSIVFEMGSWAQGRAPASIDYERVLRLDKAFDMISDACDFVSHFTHFQSYGSTYLFVSIQAGVYVTPRGYDIGKIKLALFWAPNRVLDLPRTRAWIADVCIQKRRQTWDDMLEGRLTEPEYHRCVRDLTMCRRILLAGVARL